MASLDIQDVARATIGIILFPIVFVIPGYLIGKAFDIFKFKQRSLVSRYTIGIVLSNAIVPIASYLAVRFLSLQIWAFFLLGTAGVAASIHIVFCLQNRNRRPLRIHQARTAGEKMGGFLLCSAWIVITIATLVDIRIGNKLYSSNVSYDYTTRIAIINAITRTGIPPVNPGYYPGHSEKLTFLYYYWYILPSIINYLGGSLINSRQAMIAGTAWNGIGLMAIVALYLQVRNEQNSDNRSNLPLLGILLLVVSGLDFIPVVAIEASRRLTLGHMILEGTVYNWNLPVISWFNASMWVPNHVAAVGQCMTALLIFLNADKTNTKQLAVSGAIAGLCFASALGTSTWITFVFAMAWIILALVLLLRIRHWISFLTMAGSGLLGLTLSIPFMLGLLNENGGSPSVLPIAFYIRPFSLVQFLAPSTLQVWLNLLFLPVNYLMELGIFFIFGLYWLQYPKSRKTTNNVFIIAESTLLIIVAIILSFVYSTVEQINDLGIRGGLLGQFILLVWGAEIVHGWLDGGFPNPKNIFNALGRQPNIGKALQTLLIIGLLTTGLDAFLTRTWPLLVDWNIAGFPNTLSPDANYGARNYNAKLAYEYVNIRLHANAVIQYNPTISLDRPSGLYDERQIAISDRTAYGVPKGTFEAIQSDIALIFNSYDSWDDIDNKCSKYSIDALVVYDLDPLWRLLPKLEQQRQPLYKNQYYAVIACGKSAPP